MRMYREGHQLRLRTQSLISWETGYLHGILKLQNHSRLSIFAEKV